MTTGGFGKCCISGHLHDGTPKGKEATLHGLPTYIAGDESNKNKTIVYVTDIFGYNLPNARLLADEIASNGFYVLIPDLLENDPVPAELVLKIAPRESAPERSETQAEQDQKEVGATLGPWLEKHSFEKVKPVLEKFVKGVKSENGGKVGAVGYCWGGKLSMILAHDHVDAAVACHPSFLEVPGDLKDISKPVSIAVGDKDQMMDADAQKNAKQYFENDLEKKGVKTEFVIYPGEVHGFAVRGDLNVESEKAAKEKVTKQTIDWFKAHLA